MSVLTVGLWYILCVFFFNSSVCTTLADSIKGKVSYQFSYEDPWKRQWPPVWWSQSEHLFSKTVPIVKELNSKYWETAYWKYMFLNKSECWKTVMCGALVLLTFFLCVQGWCSWPGVSVFKKLHLKTPASCLPSWLWLSSISSVWLFKAAMKRY